MPERQGTLTVPKEFAGRWIAWDFARTRIVASGRTLIEAKRAAESLGETHPVLAKVPARIVPANDRQAGRKLGSLRGSVVSTTPDFDAPLPQFKDYMK